MKPSTSPAAQEDGWALVSVLYVVAMLTLMAAAVQALLLTSAQLEQRVWDRAKIDAVLDAAVLRAVLGVGDARPNARWRVTGTEEHFVYAGTEVAIRIQDQLGLIDLNAADGSMLTRLLQSQDVSEEDAKTLTERILDWRGKATDDSKARDVDYKTSGRSYQPRHGAFQSVAELQLVLGITPALYARLASALTVYSGHPSFEQTTAPEAVLRALYLDKPEEVTRIVMQRQQAGDNLLGSRTGTLSVTQGLAGRALSIDASAKVDGRTYKRHAVVILTDDAKRPYLTLAWQ